MARKFKPGDKGEGIKHFSGDLGALMTSRDALRADDMIK